MALPQQGTETTNYNHAVVLFVCLVLMALPQQGTETVQ